MHTIPSCSSPCAATACSIQARHAVLELHSVCTVWITFHITCSVWCVRVGYFSRAPSFQKVHPLVLGPPSKRETNKSAVIPRSMFCVPSFSVKRVLCPLKATPLPTLTNTTPTTTIKIDAAATIKLAEEEEERRQRRHGDLVANVTSIVGTIAIEGKLCLSD